MRKLRLFFALFILLSACSKSEPSIDYESHYQSTFQTDVPISIYDENHHEIGIIEANTVVSLEPYNNNNYFQLKDFPYYIYYEDVGEAHENPPLNSYPNFILFSEILITISPFHLYTLEEDLYLTVNDSLSASILIKGSDFYTIQIKDSFYKIPISDIDEIIVSDSSQEIASEVPVLMYHFFYSKENNERPLDNNWLEVTKFEEQLQYLSENEFHILSMIELEHFLNNEVQVPKKSVVLTIDDGDPSVYQYAYPLLEKYQISATTFLITSWYWWDIDNRINDYVELHSHSHDMHRGGCNIQHGGRILCIDFEEGVADLKTSQEYLYGSFVFCYPFGDYNDHAKEMLITAGYRLAFTTKFGNVKPGMDLLELPRVRISNELSLAQFIHYITK